MFEDSILLRLYVRARVYLRVFTCGRLHSIQSLVLGGRSGWGEGGGEGDKRFAAANHLLWQRYQALAGPIFDVLCPALPLTASAPFSLHSALQDDL